MLRWTFLGLDRWGVRAWSLLLSLICLGTGAQGVTCDSLILTVQTPKPQP